MRKQFTIGDFKGAAAPVGERVARTIIGAGVGKGFSLLEKDEVRNYLIFKPIKNERSSSTSSSISILKVDFIRSNEVSLRP